LVVGCVFGKDFYSLNRHVLSMNCPNRALTLTFIVLLLASLFTLPTSSVAAQAGYQPSVPQFTVKLIDNSYDVPPSSYTVIDQYTGQETTKTFPGSHVIDRSIEVMVKNQPFTSYTNTSGHAIELYYIIQVKGHYGEGWRSISKVPLFLQIKVMDILPSK